MIVDFNVMNNVQIVFLVYVINVHMDMKNTILNVELFVVMDYQQNNLNNVMMEILMMMMDVILNVKLKKIGYVFNHKLLK